MFDVEKIRGEFPILGREVYGKPLVYLDNGATAQKPLAVIETIDYLNRELNANIHRGVHYLSEEATTLYEASRERIRAFIGAAEKEEVIFTAGATASLNTVAYAWGEKFVRAGDNIVVSEMEHHSNIVPWQMLCERKGAEIRVLPFDDEGRLRTELLPSLLDGRTRRIRSARGPNCAGLSTRRMPWGRSPSWTDVRASCTGARTCRSWIAISTHFRGISSSLRRVSACCTANARCWRRCRRFWAAGTWSIR